MERKAKVLILKKDGFKSYAKAREVGEQKHEDDKVTDEELNAANDWLNPDENGLDR